MTINSLDASILDSHVKALTAWGDDDSVPAILRDDLKRFLPWVAEIRPSADRRSATAGVRVKKLEWVTLGKRGNLFEADTGVGVYRIQKFSGETAYDLKLLGRDWFVGDLRTLEDAKAAAQADYETRALSALDTTPIEPTPSLQKGEGDGWQEIATAPRDGRDLIGCWTRPDGGAAVYGIIWWEDGEWHEYDIENVVSDPTHWRPLPTPPEPSP